METVLPGCDHFPQDLWALQRRSRHESWVWRAGSAFIRSLSAERPVTS